ncbi:MAG TPA: LytR C-terminal domain-containing protein [Longimicrobium sp.]|nr:LytR C-terminal domain-containing protein [Longimicrobium sp.]
MSRSKRRSPASGTAGKRLQTVGLFLTLLLVAVLVGSLAAGLVGGRGGAPAGPQARDSAGGARRGNAPLPAERVRVEVLNASGVPGVAARGRTLLRDRGFDVVYVGNAQGYQPDTSLVLDRVGRMELARAVADEIDIPRVVARPDSNVYADVTVVLGRDWVAGHPDAAPDD